MLAAAVFVVASKLEEMRGMMLTAEGSGGNDEVWAKLQEAATLGGRKADDEAKVGMFYLAHLALTF